LTTNLQDVGFDWIMKRLATAPAVASRAVMRFDLEDGALAPN